MSFNLKREICSEFEGKKDKNYNNKQEFNALKYSLQQKRIHKNAKENQSKFSGIYAEANSLYSKAFEYEKKNQRDLALVYFELAQFKYGYYLDLKKKYGGKK